jgi:hypothetical protein
MEAVLKIITPLLFNKYHIYPNLWQCNKYLYNYSVVSYFNNNKLPEITLPTLCHTIPPNCHHKPELFLVICRQTKEYFLCMLHQMFELLHNMFPRWSHVEIHAYTDCKCLTYYGINDYNYVYVCSSTKM